MKLSTVLTLSARGPFPRARPAERQTRLASIWPLARSREAAWAAYVADAVVVEASIVTADDLAWDFRFSQECCQGRR